MRIPVWLTVAIAILVTGFGAFRIYLAIKKPVEDEGARRGGFYRTGRRTHALIGTVYLLLGAALIATTFGWSPFGDLFGVDAETPPKSEAPSTNVPLDQPKR